MKKLFFICAAMAGALQLQAQNINPEFDQVGPKNMTPPAMPATPDFIWSRWCVDLNVMGGKLYQHLGTGDMSGGYNSSLNAVNTGLKTDNASTIGLEAQASYFFDNDEHFGIGTGIIYLRQKYDATMDAFHVEYQSTDVFGNTFRQLVTANGPIKESVTVSNINIPILLKYKTHLCDRWDFTADGGILVNLQARSKYNANASFDYEAIYQYTGDGSTTFDNAPTPAASDLLITRNNTHGDVQSYFNSLRSLGYNVGLGVTPDHTTGHVSYAGGSLGFLLRPAVSYHVSDAVAINAGVYYLFQGFTHNIPSNYQVTDKIGSYSSVLNNVGTATNNTYGISVGVRFYLLNRTAMPAVIAPDAAAQEPAPKDQYSDDDDDDAPKPAPSK